MINTCDPYNHFIEQARYEDFNKLDKDSVNAQIKLFELNNPATGDRDKSFYGQRSYLYFGAKEYDKALEDLNKLLVLDPDNAQMIFLKGWLLELKKDYDQAVLMYDEAAKISGNVSYGIFTAIAKIKQSGK